MANLEQLLPSSPVSVPGSAPSPDRRWANEKKQSTSKKRIGSTEQKMDCFQNPSEQIVSFVWSLDASMSLELFHQTIRCCWTTQPFQQERCCTAERNSRPFLPMEGGGLKSWDEIANHLQIRIVAEGYPTKKRAYCTVSMVLKFYQLNGLNPNASDKSWASPSAWVIGRPFGKTRSPQAAHCSNVSSLTMRLPALQCSKHPAMIVWDAKGLGCTWAELKLSLCICFPFLIFFGFMVQCWQFLLSPTATQAFEAKGRFVRGERAWVRRNHSSELQLGSEVLQKLCKVCIASFRFFPGFRNSS